MASEAAARELMASKGSPLYNVVQPERLANESLGAQTHSGIELIIKGRVCHVSPS